MGSIFGNVAQFLNETLGLNNQQNSLANQQNSLVQAQQQSYLQNQMAQFGVGGNGGIGYYSSGAVGGIITISPEHYAHYKTPEPLRLAAKAESALEWLDRRVNEMRVAL